MWLIRKLIWRIQKQTGITRVFLIKKEEHSLVSWKPALLTHSVIYTLIWKALIPGGRIVRVPGTEISAGVWITLLFLRVLRGRLKMPRYQHTSWAPTIVLLNLRSIYDEIAGDWSHCFFYDEKGERDGKHKRDCEIGECICFDCVTCTESSSVCVWRKRKLVHQVMEELDYTPNRTAIDLIRGKTQTIGVILPYSDHPCFDKIVNGITKAAFRHEYATTLLPTNYNPDIEIKYLELLRMKK